MRLASGMARVVALLFALSLGWATHASAQAVPTMTVKIINNSTDYNIYPVLSTGTALPIDEWLQAAFKVPKAQLPQNPYPKPDQYRIYVNPKGDGIPPGKFITLTVPLYTQLVAKPNPKLAHQYVDWWGGGRIEIFDAPHANHAPPLALQKLYPNRPGQTRVTPLKGAALPRCTTCQNPIEIFVDPNGLKNNEPSQLTEYTLGAIKRNGPTYVLDLHNVDYDVSYVDAAYMPVLMEPFNNIQVGYVGTILTVDKFRAAVAKFIGPNSRYKGWPQFVDEQGDLIPKIASPLHALAGDPDLLPQPAASKPLLAMRSQWDICVDPASADQRPICLYMRNVDALFEQNYKNYKNNFVALGCPAKAKPIPRTDSLIYAHVQAWAPFNENCNNSKVNLLHLTPGYTAKQSLKYRQVKEQFDDLQYWPDGSFNPYALFIHGEDYVNTAYVYAYSVDDAVGNMQVMGDGLIIAVGGTRGLPNPHPATKPIHIAFGYSPKDKIRFIQYGVCSDTPETNVDPDFASFDISTTFLKTCVLSFLDNRNKIYKFMLSSPPPYPEVAERTPETHTMIDCSLNTDQAALNWCNDVFGYSTFLLSRSKTEQYVIAPAPAQPPPTTN